MERLFLYCSYMPARWSSDRPMSRQEFEARFPDDTWHWDDMVSGQALIELRDSPHQEAAKMLDAMVGFLSSFDGKIAL